MGDHGRHSSPRTRPVVAVLIVAATVFLLLGRNCGVLGALLAGSVDRLLGAAGMGLLCLTAWALAFILATPVGTFSRLVVTLWRHTVARRHTPSVVVMKTRGDERTRSEGVDVGPGPTMSVLAPRDRMALQDVRTTLKGLGHEKNEIEPLIAQMDPAAGFEKNVKSALKALRVN